MSVEPGLERRARGQDRDTVAILTALEPVYLPRVVLSERPPVGVDWDQLHQYPVYLRRCGRRCPPRDDPVRGPSTRRGAGEPRGLAPQWERLKGDALSAMDHRIAAEILFLFYEALVAQGAAEALRTIPGRGWHPF